MIDPGTEKPFIKSTPYQAVPMFPTPGTSAFYYKVKCFIGNFFQVFNILFLTKVQNWPHMDNPYTGVGIHGYLGLVFSADMKHFINIFRQYIYWNSGIFNEGQRFFIPLDPQHQSQPLLSYNPHIIIGLPLGKYGVSISPA